jgi:hypothetical protein
MAVTSPDVSEMVPVDGYVGEDDEETMAGAGLLNECERYALSFPWCERIVGGYVGLLIPPVLGVVLFEIVPLRGADPWIWVIGGDLPSAYLEFDDEYTPTADQALESYVGNMAAWVQAVQEGGDLDNVFPVDAPPTAENAALLQRRLEFIQRRILPNPPASAEE